MKIALRILATRAAVKVYTGPTYLIALNYDYCEDMEKAYTRREMHETLVREMRIRSADHDVTDADVVAGTEAFWMLIGEEYNNKNWRGLSIYTFCPETHRLHTYER